MTKLYKRKGRRFVEVPDYRGMYYNNDGTFSKERKSNSIALCVDQSPTDITLCMLRYSENKTWKEAKIFCANFIDGGYLPEIDELLHAYTEYRFLFPIVGTIWSSTEYDSKNARYLALHGGYVYYNGKNYINSVFVFLKLPI